jgi:hypothetical protein
MGALFCQYPLLLQAYELTGAILRIKIDPIYIRV